MKKQIFYIKPEYLSLIFSMGVLLWFKCAVQESPLVPFSLIIVQMRCISGSTSDTRGNRETSNRPPLQVSGVTKNLQTKKKCICIGGWSITRRSPQTDTLIKTLCLSARSLLFLLLFVTLSLSLSFSPCFFPPFFLNPVEKPQHVPQQRKSGFFFHEKGHFQCREEIRLRLKTLESIEKRTSPVLGKGLESARPLFTLLMETWARTWHQPACVWKKIMSTEVHLEKKGKEDG